MRKHIKSLIAIACALMLPLFASAADATASLLNVTITDAAQSYLDKNYTEWYTLNLTLNPLTPSAFENGTARTLVALTDVKVVRHIDDGLNSADETLNDLSDINYSKDDKSFSTNRKDLNTYTGTVGTPITITDAFKAKRVKNTNNSFTVKYTVTANCELKWSESTEGNLAPRRKTINVEVISDGTEKGTTSSVGTATFSSSIPTAVEDVEAARQVAGVSYYNLAGQQSDAPFSGVNIVKTVYTDGTSTVAKVLR